MRLTDHLPEDLLLPHVASRDKIPLFHEMVDHLLARLVYDELALEEIFEQHGASVSHAGRL